MLQGFIKAEDVGNVRSFIIFRGISLIIFGFIIYLVMWNISSAEEITRYLSFAFVPYVFLDGIIVLKWSSILHKAGLDNIKSKIRGWLGIFWSFITGFIFNLLYLQGTDYMGTFTMGIWVLFGILDLIEMENNIYNISGQNRSLYLNHIVIYVLGGLMLVPMLGIYLIGLYSFIYGFILVWTGTSRRIFNLQEPDIKVARRNIFLRYSLTIAYFALIGWLIYCLIKQ
jgi:hypothetical protein